MGALTRAKTAAPHLAYASVGRSGDFSGSRGADSDDAAQTWTFTFGVGWLYGLGLCVGPFFGTGVGLTIPGGVLAGAGGGVGVVVGVGMGSGLVWGSGRGVVRGIGVIPPMTPPFAEGLPRLADLPTPRELANRAADTIDEFRERQRIKARRRRKKGHSTRWPLAFASPPPHRTVLLADPRWQ